MTIYADVDPSLEEKFRLVVKQRFGSSRGALVSGLEDAIRFWLAGSRYVTLDDFTLESKFLQEITGDSKCIQFRGEAKSSEGETLRDFLKTKRETLVHVESRTDEGRHLRGVFFVKDVEAHELKAWSPPIYTFSCRLERAQPSS